MKRITYTLVLFLCQLTMALQSQSQAGTDSTGLPGDNFSLQGALQLFKSASSPEEFEKALNSESNHVNNLDLNRDGQTDYVRVIEKSDANNHVFVLQVPVSEKENQDIAVIELEKTGNDQAAIQIVGDEDIYGEETIYEPLEESISGQKGGPNYYPDINAGYSNTAVVNVWYWPCVRFVYVPSYTVWTSPWYWRRYPGWWRPWRPLSWHVFHPFVRHHHRHFVHTPIHRTIHARTVYKPFRTTSVSVRTHHQGRVNHYRVSRTTIRKAPATRVKSTRTVVRGRRRG
ncbi:MAG: hypothetical protein IPH58_00645 [Sphingobacteriales bacterium]|jgi:hypothetical protein|nr:hypothetical protein [Sphingobacteriales bacterium]